MALQNEILTRAARKSVDRSTPSNTMSIVVEDLIWAFTRSHRCYSDRLVYEAFASEMPDSPWHSARRRRPGPVEFATLHMQERHILFSTATMLVQPLGYQRAFYAPFVQPDIRRLSEYLTDGDHTELRRRQRYWPQNLRG